MRYPYTLYMENVCPDGSFLDVLPSLFQAGKKGYEA